MKLVLGTDLITPLREEAGYEGLVVIRSANDSFKHKAAFHRAVRAPHENMVYGFAQAQEGVPAGGASPTQN
jgi:hypothetical protein